MVENTYSLPITRSRRACALSEPLPGLAVRRLDVTTDPTTVLLMASCEVAGGVRLVWFVWLVWLV